MIYNSKCFLRKNRKCCIDNFRMNVFPRDWLQNTILDVATEIRNWKLSQCFISLYLLFHGMSNFLLKTCCIRLITLGSSNKNFLRFFFLISWKRTYLYVSFKNLDYNELWDNFNSVYTMPLKFLLKKFPAQNQF